jgi:cytochrome c
MQALRLWSPLLMSKFCRLFFAVATAIVAPTLWAEEAKPDIENGKATFMTTCSVCHSVQKTGGGIEGPNLIGVVGRAAGSQPDFTKYSAALKASKLTWSVQTLNKFLVNPGAMVPGTFMPMQIPDDKTRADVVAFLASLKKE